MVECDPEYTFLGHSDTNASLSSSLTAANDPPLEDAREPWVRSDDDDDDDAMRDDDLKEYYPACVRNEPPVFASDTGRERHRTHPPRTTTLTPDFLSNAQVSLVTACTSAAPPAVSRSRGERRESTFYIRCVRVPGSSTRRDGRTSSWETNHEGGRSR